MIKEFRDFLLRGNIVELAVAFVIGAAFALVVKSLNDNLLMPIIAMIGGKPDFSSLTFTINGAVFRYGAFITDLIGFVADRRGGVLLRRQADQLDRRPAQARRGGRAGGDAGGDRAAAGDPGRPEGALTRPGTPALGCCQAGIMGRCVSRSSVSG